MYRELKTDGKSFFLPFAVNVKLNLSNINLAVENSGEFERAFRGAVQYALDTGFAEILELKPVQEEA